MKSFRSTARVVGRLAPLALLYVLFTAAALSCSTPGFDQRLGAQAPSSPLAIRSDVALAYPPYTAVATEWKERLDQPYVFLEIVGPYEETGRFIDELRRHIEAQGLRSSGAPFALFYDDPMRVPAESRRSRIAVPVDTNVPVASPLGFAVLPGARVVYAHAAGRYDQVFGAYPAMFEVMRTRGWVLDGPIREIYLVDPTSVATNNELVTEIQMPWQPL